MLRALVHVGLAALLVIAPALCCCNVRLIAGQFIAPSTPNGSCPASPEPDPGLPSSCCHTAKAVAQKKSCCHDSQPSRSDAPKPQNQSRPTAPQHRCDFCCAKPSATPPKNLTAVAAPEPTGELIPVALLGLTALPPEHLVLLGGLDPPEWAGVDCRSESLFARHVLRC
jgi:hypothetical protein